MEVVKRHWRFGRYHLGSLPLSLSISLQTKAMAKHKEPVLKRKPKEGMQRYRRTDAELIADLEKKIAELKVRKATKALKASPAAAQANNAYRALTKGIDLCQGSDDSDLKRALSGAQRTLADHFETKGISLPKARKPRARKSR